MSEIYIDLPENVQFILNTLEFNDYKAYVVGGCVRDSLLNIVPKDWDICTDCLPETILEIFKDFNVIKTGLQHGTVTVVIENVPYEITTFRKDGDYTDRRRPDSVKFVSDVVLDLSRRDFTVNSMAYNHKEGLIDPFCGQEDLNNRIIRCVGVPDDRFEEDALRLLRAARFACRFNFMIESATMRSMYDYASTIEKISQERITSELNQILLSPNFITGMKLLKQSNLLKYVLPELFDCIDVQQNNNYHQYKVYDHILRSVTNIEPKLYLCLTMLFHDIAKPQCKTTDEKGIDHFYRHNEVGARMTDIILRRMKYDNETITKVVQLVSIHNCDIPCTIGAVKRWLNKIGEDTFRDLLKVKYADMYAQSVYSIEQKKPKLAQLKLLLEQVLVANECFSKKDLAINGANLIDMGFKEGKIIGEIINELVKMVIDSPEINTKERLLRIVSEQFCN
jgi:tRNA nucleotidyltransferase (CCA-adding enzyme)